VLPYLWETSFPLRSTSIPGYDSVARTNREWQVSHLNRFSWCDSSSTCAVGAVRALPHLGHIVPASEFDLVGGDPD
jgi:hypothetical protein